MYTRLLKSLNRLHPRVPDFGQLMRLDKPVGIYLLLWPQHIGGHITAGGSKYLFILQPDKPHIHQPTVIHLGVSAGKQCIDDH